MHWAAGRPKLPENAISLDIPRYPDSCSLSSTYFTFPPRCILVPFSYRSFRPFVSKYCEIFPVHQTWIPDWAKWQKCYQWRLIWIFLMVLLENYISEILYKVWIDSFFFRWLLLCTTFYYVPYIGVLIGRKFENDKILFKNCWLCYRLDFLPQGLRVNFFVN